MAGYGFWDTIIRRVNRGLGCWLQHPPGVEQQDALDVARVSLAASLPRRRR